MLLDLSDKHDKLADLKSQHDSDEAIDQKNLGHKNPVCSPC